MFTDSNNSSMFCVLLSLELDVATVTTGTLVTLVIRTFMYFAPCIVI